MTSWTMIVLIPLFIIFLLVFILSKLGQNKLPSSPYDAYQQGRKEREDEIIVLMYQIKQQNKDDYESMWDILFRQIKEKKEQWKMK